MEVLVGKYGKIIYEWWKLYKTNRPTLLRCSLERNTRPSLGNLYLPKDVAGWVGPSRSFWSVMYQSNGKSSGVNLKPSTNRRCRRLCIASLDYNEELTWKLLLQEADILPNVGVKAFHWSVEILRTMETSKKGWLKPLCHLPARACQGVWKLPNLAPWPSGHTPGLQSKSEMRSNLCTWR